jgi:hypothetical protein
MKKMTFDDWKLVGRQVKKNQKAAGQNLKGEAIFTIEQTKPLPGFDQGTEGEE